MYETEKIFKHKNNPYTNTYNYFFFKNPYFDALILYSCQKYFKENALVNKLFMTRKHEKKCNSENMSTHTQQQTQTQPGKLMCSLNYYY